MFLLNELGVVFRKPLGWGWAGFTAPMTFGEFPRLSQHSTASRSKRESPGAAFDGRVYVIC